MSDSEKKSRTRKDAKALWDEAFAKMVKALEMRKQELFDKGNMEALPKIQEAIKDLNEGKGSFVVAFIDELIGG